MSLADDWESAVPVASKPAPDLKADWEKAKPIDFKPKAEKKPAAPGMPIPRALDPFGMTQHVPMTDLAGAAAEPLLSLGSGAIAAPLSGLAGIAGTMMPGEEGQGARWAKAVGRQATYEPRTAGGKNAMSAIGYLPEKIEEGTDWAGGKTTDITGSPGAGAGVKALLEFLPQLLGVKGASKLKKPPAPEINPNAKALLDRDIPLTPGELKGGALGRVEEGLQSIPFFGDSVKDARGRSVHEFNTSAINDSLKPIGKELPKGLQGNEAIAWARDALGTRMDELTLKMTGELDAPRPKNALPAPGQLGQPPKPTLRDELEALRKLASGGNLPEEALGQLNRIIDRDILGKFTKQGKADGATLQEIGTTLRGHIERMGRSENPDVQHLGQAVKEMNAAVDRMIKEINPKLAPEWDAAKDGYSRFKIAQDAAGRKGAREGVFTPSQYDSAVRAKDKTKDKRAYSEGTARQQDLSSPAVDRLSPKLPDSGTPFRTALLRMLNPKAAAMTAGLGIPTSILYSPQGIQLMMKLLTDPPGAGRMGAMAAPVGAQQYANQLQPPPQ